MEPSNIRPLEGITVVSAGGLGPVSFCCMLLADLGARVIRVERPTDSSAPLPPGLTGPVDILGRGQERIGLDLKRSRDAAALLDMLAEADVLLEGFRPGVMERLGLGPAECARRNERLIYGRLTGWGQEGPLAKTAGHDINYLALTGILDLIGHNGGPPVPPLNLLGDFAGSALFMANGVLAAIIRRDRTGAGAVIDAAIVDGVSVLMAQVREVAPDGAFARGRGCNLLDGGAPFYGVFECADGRYVAVGAVESHFFRKLLEILELDPLEFDTFDPGRWAGDKERLASVFRTKTRDEWITLAGDRDACLTPVLTLEESCKAEHLLSRGTLREKGQSLEPAPAPRFAPLPGI